MPVLVLQPPSLPALQTYIALSCLSLAWCVLYASDTLETVENAGLTDHLEAGQRQEAPAWGWNNDAGANETEKSLFGIQVGDGEIVKLCRIMMGDVWSVLSLINVAFCLLILVGKMVQHITFGELRAGERQHLRDKLWKFVFFKFIIVFGVLSVQTLDQMVMWMAWFAALAFLNTMSELCKDRFEYLSFSPSSMTMAHSKVLILLVIILAISQALIALCCYMGVLDDWNLLLFTVSEVIVLQIRTIYVLIRYGIHFYDLNYDGVWETRGTIMYYTDLISELLVLCLEFIHNLHMLLWGNVFLSMASLVICMELRYVYNGIQQRIHRHYNYRQVVHNMQTNFPLATDQELTDNNDDCAICWEEMKTARKLPCNHLFHNTCLRSWLEHETSCPTCRHALSIRNTNNGQAPPTAHGAQPMEEEAGGGGAQPVQQRRGRNHFFHFDGSRIASWIPSFSVEVSHRHLRHHRALVRTSQLNNMASHVQQMFPAYPTAMLIEDLRSSRSVEVTIDNILEGRLTLPPEPLETDTVEQSPTPDPPVPPNPDIGHGSGMYDAPRNEASNAGQYGAVAMGAGELPQLARHLSDGDRPPTEGHLSYQDTRLPDSDSTTPPHISDGPQAFPARFSKSSVERETILKDRKQQLIQQARRRFQSRQVLSNAPPSTISQPLASSAPSPNQNPSSRDPEESVRIRRRLAAYEAAMRRMDTQ